MNCQGYYGDGTQRGIEWLKPPPIHGKIYRGFTWNPFWGCTNTPDICATYYECWARAMAKRHGDDEFAPRFFPQRLQTPLHRKTPAVIAVGLMGDLFSWGIPSEWIHQILAVCQQATQHIFLFLTKNPARLKDFATQLLHPHLWIGVSVCTKQDVTRLYELAKIDTSHTFISCEPLLDPLGHFIDGTLLFWAGIHWMIIGGQSGPHATSPPQRWIAELGMAADDASIPVLIKRNARYPEMVREWPHSILQHLQNAHETNQLTRR